MRIKFMSIYLNYLTFYPQKSPI